MDRLFRYRFNPKKQSDALWGIPHTPFPTSRICQPSNNQIDKLLILEAADRGTNSLIDAKVKVVPLHIELVVEQVAVPSDAGNALRSTPEESIAPNILETTTTITITTWES